MSFTIPLCAVKPWSMNRIVFSELREPNGVAENRMRFNFFFLRVCVAYNEQHYFNGSVSYTMQNHLCVHFQFATVHFQPTGNCSVHFAFCVFGQMQLFIQQSKAFSILFHPRRVMMMVASTYLRPTHIQPAQ